LLIAVLASLLPESLLLAVSPPPDPGDLDGSLAEGSVTLLIVYLLIALGFSFLCSVAEAVLLSVTPSYLATLESKGARTGRLLQALKADVERPLAAILSLNTIAHTVGAAGGDAPLSEFRRDGCRSRRTWRRSSRGWIDWRGF
jgi:hypothetical protein